MESKAVVCKHYKQTRRFGDLAEREVGQQTLPELEAQIEERKAKLQAREEELKIATEVSQTPDSFDEFLNQRSDAQFLLALNDSLKVHTDNNHDLQERVRTLEKQCQATNEASGLGVSEKFQQVLQKFNAKLQQIKLERQAAETKLSQARDNLLRTFQHEAEAKDSRMSGLQASLSREQKVSSDLRQSLERHRDFLKKEVEALEDEHEEAVEALEKEHKEASDTSNELVDTLQSKLWDVSGAARTAPRRLETAKSRIAELEELTEWLETGNSTLRDQLQTEVGQFQAALQSSSETIDRFQDDVQEWQTKLDQERKERNVLLAISSQKEDRIKVLEGLLNEKDSEIGNLKSEAESTKTTAEKYKARYEGLKEIAYQQFSDLEKLQDNSLWGQARIRELQAANKELEDRLATQQ